LGCKVLLCANYQQVTNDGNYLKKPIPLPSPFYIPLFPYTAAATQFSLADTVAESSIGAKNTNLRDSSN